MFFLTFLYNSWSNFGCCVLTAVKLWCLFDVSSFKISSCVLRRAHVLRVTLLLPRAKDVVFPNTFDGCSLIRLLIASVHACVVDLCVCVALGPGQWMDDVMLNQDLVAYRRTDLWTLCGLIQPNGLCACVCACVRRLQRKNNWWIWPRSFWLSLGEWHHCELTNQYVCVHFCSLIELREKWWLSHIESTSFHQGKIWKGPVLK